MLDLIAVGAADPFYNIHLEGIGNVSNASSEPYRLFVKGEVDAVNHEGIGK